MNKQSRTSAVFDQVRNSRHPLANSTSRPAIERPHHGLLALLLFLTAHCGGGLALAPEAEAPSAELVVVDSLPPPAIPEEVPPLPKDKSHLVWTDGCWEWSIGRWIWVRGGWVDAPQGGAYFPGKIAVGPGGNLLWSPCSWIVDGASVGPLPPLLPARYPASARSVAR